MPSNTMLIKTGGAAALIIAVATSAQVMAQEDRYIDVTPFFTRVDKDRNSERQSAGLRTAFGWRSHNNWFTEVQLFGTRLKADRNYFAPYTPLPPTVLPFNSTATTPNQSSSGPAAIISTGDPVNAAGYPYAASYAPFLYEPVPSGDVELSGIGVDVVYSFNGRHGYSPFLLAGFGAAQNNTKHDYGPRATNAFVNFAAGITTGAISESGLKLRAEVRYLHDFFADGMNDWQFGFGFSVPLICPPDPPPVFAAAPQVPPRTQIYRDSDADGVVDRNDHCPDTLPSAEVDQTGCIVAEQTITLGRAQNRRVELNFR